MVLCLQETIIALPLVFPSWKLCTFLLSSIHVLLFVCFCLFVSLKLHSSGRAFDHTLPARRPTREGPTFDFISGFPRLCGASRLCFLCHYHGAYQGALFKLVPNGQQGLLLGNLKCLHEYWGGGNTEWNTLEVLKVALAELNFKISLSKWTIIGGWLYLIELYS